MTWNRLNCIEFLDFPASQCDDRINISIYVFIYLLITWPTFTLTFANCLKRKKRPEIREDNAILQRSENNVRSLELNSGDT